MDTDDLSDMAYASLLIAEKITHSFTVGLGAMSYAFHDEDSYLREMLTLVRRTKRHPNEYIEEWSLENDLSAKMLRKGMIELEKHNVGYSNKRPWFETQILTGILEREGVEEGKVLGGDQRRSVVKVRKIFCREA